MKKDNYIHLLNGQYFGFIRNNALFSRDGLYLGWVDDDDSVWNASGKYCGKVTKVQSN